MKPVQHDTQQLYDLVRALEATPVQPDDDDDAIVVVIQPPPEINSSSNNTTQSQTDESVSPMQQSQEQQPTDSTGASAFNATTDIANFFSNNMGTDDDCTFSTDLDAPLCNITSLRCTNTQTSLIIPYDYEIHYPAQDQKQLSHIIQVIEGNMLDQLALEMNLRDCAKSNADRRLQTSFSDDLLDRLTGISLLPRDAPTAESCLVTLDTDKSSSEAFSPRECRSVKGAVTVYTYVSPEESQVPAQARLEIQQAVRGAVQRGMADNKYLAAGNGQTVVYLGDRKAVLATTASQSTTNNGWGPRAIGLVSAAAVLVLVVTAVICFIRGRFQFGKGSRYVRDTSGSSVGSESRAEKARQDDTEASSLGAQASSQDPQPAHSAIGPTFATTSWSQSVSQDQGTECIDFDKSSTVDQSTTTSFEASTFDIAEAATDLGNYQFSYDQGISPINATFDNLYDDIEIPMTFDEVSRGSAASVGGSHIHY